MADSSYLPRREESAQLFSNHNTLTVDHSHIAPPPLYKEPYVDRRLEHRPVDDRSRLDVSARAEQRSPERRNERHGERMRTRTDFIDQNHLSQSCRIHGSSYQPQPQYQQRRMIPDPQQIASRATEYHQLQPTSQYLQPTNSQYLQPTNSQYLQPTNSQYPKPIASKYPPPILKQCPPVHANHYQPVHAIHSQYPPRTSDPVLQPHHFVNQSQPEFNQTQPMQSSYLQSRSRDTPCTTPTPSGQYINHSQLCCRHCGIAMEIGTSTICPTCGRCCQDGNANQSNTKYVEIYKR